MDLVARLSALVAFNLVVIWIQKHLVAGQLLFECILSDLVIVACNC